MDSIGSGIHPGRLVFFLQNDDHVFIDVDTSVLCRGLTLLHSEPSRFKSLYMAHWPEALRLSGKVSPPRRVESLVRTGESALHDRAGAHRDLAEIGPRFGEMGPRVRHVADTLLAIGAPRRQGARREVRRALGHGERRWPRTNNANERRVPRRADRRCAGDLRG